MNHQVPIAVILEHYKCDPWRGAIFHNGREIGGQTWKGYRRIGVGKKLVFAHRLIWAIHYGSWPDGNIDHINGDKQDNRITNLRIASKSENALNVTKPRSTNTSGFLGIWKSGSRWAASICVGGKKTTLGRFPTPSEAHAAYVKAKLSVVEIQPNTRNASTLRRASQRNPG